MATVTEREELLRIREGRAPNGQVFLRNFDQGMIETMGAKVVALTNTFKAYFLFLPNVSPPPGLPGIPVVFAFPEDYFSKWRVPIVVVRRDSVAFAPDRYHPGAQQSITVAPGALPVIGPDGRKGFTRRVVVPAAVPHDLSYTITITARHRGAPGIKNQVNLLSQYVYSVYPPRSAVIVKDSLGLYRSYDTISDDLSAADELLDVADRSLGNSLPVRVLGELDLESPVEQNQITQRATVGIDQLEE